MSAPTLTPYALMAIIALIGIPCTLYASDSREQNSRTPHVHYAMGVNKNFGRWSTPIRLAYDPSEAPEYFANAQFMNALLKDAASRWSNVSGITFEILPVGTYPADFKVSPEQRDGIVRVSWEVLPDNVLGSAGLNSDLSQQSKDYYVYQDGIIQLSKNWTWPGGTLSMLSVLVHEIGHLIGLGHSDHPASLMSADPYNGLQYPTEDDIRAAQALYGLPAVRLPAAEPVAAWKYPVPPAATSEQARYIFRPNQHDSAFARQPALALGSAPETPVISIGADVQDDDYLVLTGPVGNFLSTADINLNSAVMLTTPEGYIYRSTFGVLSCKAGDACLQGIVLPAYMGEIRKIPGEWGVYLIQPISASTPLGLLYSTSFTVAPDTSVRNAAPTARVIVEESDVAYSIRLKVLTQDAEGHQVSVRWNAYDPPETVSPAGSTAWKQLTYDGPGEYTLYVQLTDDGPRYGSLGQQALTAGSGFQTLLRVTFKLPLDGRQSVEVISSSMAVNADNTPDLLAFQPHYRSTPEWPAPFSGVSPVAELDIALNNIGKLLDEHMEIHTCVRLMYPQGSGDIGNVEEFDLVFDVLDIDQGLIGLLRTRPFNPQSALTEAFEAPDCSGQFDATTGLYRDILEVGNQTFEATFALEDPSRLTFRLTTAQAVTP